MKKITLYSKNLCGYCTMAKAWLNKNDIQFEEISIEEPQEREKFMRDYPQLRQMPQIFIDGENIGGYQQLIKLDESTLK
jgi:glutaredoxin 3